MPKLNVSVFIGMLLLFGAGCGGAAQEELPTVMPTASIQAATEVPIILTPDENRGLDETPAMPMASIAETSEAVSAPIQRGLAALTEIGTVLSVSASAVSSGITVNIEAQIPPEQDNATTMDRILEVVQQQSQAVTEIQVRTWVGEMLQSSWLWNDGAWSPQ